MGTADKAKASTDANARQNCKALPPVLAGPVLRHSSRERLVLWMVGSAPLSLRLRLTLSERGEPLLDMALGEREVQRVQVGLHAFLFLVDVELDTPLPTDTAIGYDLGVRCDDNASPSRSGESWIKDWAPHLCLPEASHPNFVIKSRLGRLFHGSCRRPHHPADDGLARVDDELVAAGEAVMARPAVLMMTGDQVYIDDVAGPMLRAIHGLIECLGLFDETLEGGTVSDSRALLKNPNTYYRREHLLPATESNEALVERFIGGVRKPVFTTTSAQNHLISLAEVMAMYLLVWSPVCWQVIRVTPPELPDDKTERYRQEQLCIDGFVSILPKAARALAHLPTYMIFDDHDITDDWNLSALWESTVYEHPFSKRIVGNALIGYLLCQGWGNNPSMFADFMPLVDALTKVGGQGSFLNKEGHKILIDRLLEFQHWDYTVATSPPLIVLDTRTRRWRSEIARGRPSGLMDWEALSEFQQAVMGEKSVVVVSPAPMFGVKLIETIQRLFTYAGRPLMVDAENWMAHRGAASVLFNIFAHSGTPQNFTILSGDVHYSFVYDVRLRHKRNSPRIWQITSSGIKNEFPLALLEWLDKTNRWLYSPKSPLNWFTKRRRMRVTPRMPTGREAGERLWNASGIGLVVLNDEGAPTEIQQLNATGGGTRFLKGDSSLHG